MAIVKLANAGESVTWRIKNAETTAGKFGPQVKFENDKGDILYISEETAGRQLGRIPLDITQCAGELLVFSRDENPKGGAPYWSIRLADAVDRTAPQQSKRIPPPSGRKLPFDEDNFPPSDAVYAVPPQEHMPVRQANMPNLNAPAPSDDDAPEWVRQSEVVASAASAPSVAPNAQKKAAYINAYFDLLGYVRAHSGLKDEVAIQAATATLHIGLKQEGLR
jgi:hypothetical protein